MARVIREPGEPGAGAKFFRSPELPGVEILRVDRLDHAFRFYTSSFVIAQIRQSSSVMGVGQERVPMFENSVCISEPERTLQHLKIDAPETVRVLFIPAAALEELAQELEAGRRHLYLRPQPRREPGLFRAVDRLHRCLEKRTTTPLEIESRYLQAMRSILGVMSKNGSLHQLDRLESRAVRMTRSQIHDRIGEKLTLADLARGTGLSRHQLFRAFCHELGVPPHEYQLAIRLNRAKAMLLQGMPAAHVAADLGFYDQSHFTQTFRNWLGVTPLEYVG